MLTLNISEVDIILANYERIHNPIKIIRIRMDAIYAVSQGSSRGQAAAQSDVHCNYVKQMAESLNITLVFLPPYPPNLNLIERVWRYIKKDVLAARYFDCVPKFHDAIR